MSNWSFLFTALCDKLCCTCLGAVSVWMPVALATMVWLLPGLGCSDRVRPEMAWTRISVMETLSSVTEKADSPNTASTASGDSTCREKMLFYCSPPDSGTSFKSRIDNSFIVFLKLIKPMTSQFWIKVLCAVVCSSASWIHVSMPLCLSLWKNKEKKPHSRWNPSAARQRGTAEAATTCFQSDG